MMRWWSELRYRLAALLGRRRMEEDLDEEFAFHLEMEARKLERAGMSPEHARREARLRFGGEERFKETARESWGVSPLTDLAGDVRFAMRQLVKRPAFTTMATLTLAIGIGGTVALYSVVDGLMLRPLPYVDEDALVAFWAGYDWRGNEFDFVKERVRSFEGVAAYSDDATTLQTEGGSRLLLYSVASAELFDVLGAAPLLGRTFRTGEDRPGAEPVIVLSYGLWQDEFGGDRDVLGRRVDLGGVRRTIVGVMPRGFFFPSPESDAWVPLDLDPDSRAYADNGWLVIAGRLREGASEPQIADDLGSLAAALDERWDYPDAWDKARDPHLIPLREYLVGDVGPVLLLLLGAVGMVLLTACANVAALVLTRTADRAGEMSVRAALGAGRARLARQVLTETVLLGLVAGGVGLAVAFAAFDVLVASLPLPRELGDTLTLDWSTLAQGLVLATAAGAVVSLAPLVGLLRGEMDAGVFTARTAAGTSRGRSRLQRGLVVAEVLLAVVLATGAALLVRTVGELRALDWGLDPTGVYTADLLFPETGTETAERRVFFEAVVERVAALPGVTSAGLINRIPVRDGGWQGSIELADRPDLTGDDRASAYFRPVTPQTFATLGIEVVEGRGIRPSDNADAPKVALVNEAFVRKFFPDGGVVGGVIASTPFAGGQVEIVGVIRDTAIDDLVGAVPPAVYFSWTQTMTQIGYGILVAKTEMDPGSLAAPIREIVRLADPRAAVGRAETMEEVADAAMAEPLRLRFFLGLFSVLGILLGTVGVYGVVAYSVQRRRAEFGIRLALGADPRSLLAEVVRAGMIPVAIGVIAGSGVALASSALLARFLFEVEPTDPVSLLVAAGALLVAGTLAALIPAWSASGTDPAGALRSD